MILNMSGGSGGQALNFSVAGSLTEPQSPAENTIWVQTETAISQYCFSGTQPEAGKEGMVWFRTGDSDRISFNALTYNAIWLQPMQAMQYRDGTWNSVPAWIRQNGAWTAWWDGLLYAAGDECTDVTGGWVAEAVPRTGGGSASARTITSGTDGLSVAAAASKGGIVRTVNRIDLSGRSSLVFEGTLYNPSSSDAEFWCSVCLWSSIGTYYQENVAAVFHAPSGTSQDQQILDLSQLPDGAYYVGFAVYGSATVTVTKLQAQ